MIKLSSIFKNKLFIITISGLLFFALNLLYANDTSAKKVIRIAFEAADIKGLDPGYTGGTQDTVLHDMIYDGLLRYKPGDVNVLETDMAERYEISRDGMEILFHLRKGIMTHPFEGYPEGIEFTSEDVVFSVQKAADPKRSSFSATFKNYIAEAIDKYTVRIKLIKRSPSPERDFDDVRGGQMICKKAYQTIGRDRFKTHPVGTGPFRFVEYFPGRKIILAAHEKYWRGRPLLDSVEGIFMPETNSREFAYRKGEIEIIEGVREQPWIDKMKKLPKTIVDIIGPGDLALISFNTSRKPFDNILVRKAFCYGIDRNEIRTFLGPDVSSPAFSVVPDYLPGGLTREEVEKAGLSYKFNPEKARELLKQAGYPNGLSIKEVVSEYALYSRPIENLHEQLRKIDVDMQLNIVDHPTYHTFIRQDKNPLVLYIAARPSTNVWLTYFFHSDSIVGKGKNPVTNFSHCNIVDDLIEEARVETNGEKQIELWKNAQYKILDNAIAYPLYIGVNVWGRSSKVKLGFEPKSSLAYYPQITNTADIQK